MKIMTIFFLAVCILTLKFFLNLFLAVLGLCCYSGFSKLQESLAVVCGFLTAMASIVLEFQGA